MWLIILYPLFFGFLIWKDKERSQHKLYTLLIWMFFFSGLAAIYLMHEDIEYATKELNWIAIVYHIFALWLILSPFKDFDKKRFEYLEPSPNRVIIPFSIAIIFVMMAYFFDCIGDVDFYTLVTDSQELRQNLDVEYNDKGSLLSYFAYYGRLLAVVPLVLVFYFIIHLPSKKLLIYLLLFSSFCSVIISLREGGREYLLKYIFIFGCIYYMTKNNIPSNWTKKINRLFFIFIAIFGTLFLIISFLRFNYDVRGYSTTHGLLAYYGQGLVNFSERFINYPDGIYHAHGQHTFPIIAGHGSANAQLLAPAKYPIRTDIFTTGIGTWLFDLGIWLTLVVSASYHYLFKKIGNIPNYTVFTLIYYALAYEFIFSSLFFFHSAWNGSKVFAFILIIGLDYITRKK